METTRGAKCVFSAVGRAKPDRRPVEPFYPTYLAQSYGRGWFERRRNSKILRISNKDKVYYSCNKYLLARDF